MKDRPMIEFKFTNWGISKVKRDGNLHLVSNNNPITPVITIILWFPDGIFGHTPPSLSLSSISSSSDHNFRFSMFYFH